MQALAWGGGAPFEMVREGMQVPEVRLSLRSWPFVCPTAWRPALLSAAQWGMGGMVGAGFGALCGNALVWIGLGVALGMALGKVRYAALAQAAQPGS